jgi:hypothetical protein
VGIGVGSGGSVGSAGVLVGTGVGETVGAAVSGFVTTGGAVGAAVGGFVAAGGAVGGGVGACVDVRGSLVVPGSIDPAEPGDVSGFAGPATGTADGDAGAALGAALFASTASRVRLKPASARATASDGPRSTYSVKDARPAWPRARSVDFPSIPPTLGR